MLSSSCPDYLTELVQSFSEHSNTEYALQMKKYMNNKFNFYGIKAPLRKELSKLHWNKHGYLPEKNADNLIKWCWGSDQRELQYFAMDSLLKTAKKPDFKKIDIYEYLIIHKSWWDTVDLIAANLVGPYFLQYPDRIVSKTNTWLQSANIWLQRSALLFQLKYKTNTDTQLLEKYILALKPSGEFFIQKAIGWALREYSKTNPEYVIRLVGQYKLAGLSEREALKWMKNKSIIDESGQFQY